MAAVGRSRPKPAGYRYDIQGLRAVAVVLVVLEHAFAWPRGGVLGVDVFYVISGFIITSLLLREFETRGTISLRGFYARRVRRILPAAMTVLTATVAAAAVLWFVPRALRTAVDAFSAAIFVSNWRFIAVDVDYLNGAAAVSPVQHFWSLSIEEQFYALWPLALLLCLALFKAGRRALVVALLVAIGLGLGWAAYRTATNPNAAYFDTLARSWELLAGALVAVIGVARPGVGTRVRNAASWGGVALIAVGAVAVSAESTLPFPWVAPAVLGAMLVVWADAAAGPRSLLGNRVAQWLGDISYSLYLWHLPVLIFVTSVLGETPGVLVACIALMLALSAASYRFIEQPFIGRRKARRRLAEPGAKRRGAAALRYALGLVVAGTAVVALALTQLDAPGVVKDPTRWQRWFVAPAPAEVDAGLTSDGQRAAIESAIGAAAWPGGVRTELDRLSRRYSAAELQAPCMNSVTQEREAKYCGDPAQDEVMLLGDSAAVSWAPTVRYYAERTGLGGVTTMGFSNCSLFEVAALDRTGLQSFIDQCAERREEMFDLVEKHHPSLVVLSASESVVPLTGLPPDEAARAYRDGVERTLERLSGVPQVVILTGPPHIGDPRSCATRMGGPATCLGEVSEDSKRKDAADEAAAQGFENAVTVPTSDWFCVEGVCPVFIGEHLRGIDPSHLTEATAAGLGPLLIEQLEARGVPSAR